MNKICNECLELKPLEAFSKHTHTKDGLYKICKTCKGKLIQIGIVKNKPKRLYEEIKYCNKELEKIRIKLIIEDILNQNPHLNVIDLIYLILTENK